MNGHPFVMTFSGQFFVSVGPPFKLALKSFVGTAFGGEPFSSNPIVAVCDRGNNILPTYNNGSISASLITIPDTISQTALPILSMDWQHFEASILMKLAIRIKFNFLSLVVLSHSLPLFQENLMWRWENLWQ